MAKLSVLLLYTKVFPTQRTILAARITAATVACWSVGAVISTALICRPISYSWGGTQDGHCGDQVALYKGIGAINLITDVACLALPMKHLFKIQLPPVRKNALLMTFALGFL